MHQSFFFLILMRKIFRGSLKILGIFGINLILFIFLFLIAEIFYRLYKDGFQATMAHCLSIHKAPFSPLGAHGYLIYDEDLGYRLNPHYPGINQRSVRHGEIVVPKPASLKRMLILGDSLVWE